MPRKPPKGKPSLQPTVTLLKNLELLVPLLHAWVPTSIGTPILCSVLKEAAKNVAYLLNNGAPTIALSQIVQMAEDTKLLTNALSILGSRTGTALKKYNKYQEYTLRTVADALDNYISKSEGDSTISKTTKQKSKESGIRIPPRIIVTGPPVKGKCKQALTTHVMIPACRQWSPFD